MRPIRRYEIHFAHPGTPTPIKLMTVGDTPCNAKNTAWTLLERYLALPDSVDLPRQGWRIEVFEDLGIAGS